MKEIHAFAIINHFIQHVPHIFELKMLESLSLCPLLSIIEQLGNLFFFRGCLGPSRPSATVPPLSRNQYPKAICCFSWIRGGGGIRVAKIENPSRWGVAPWVVVGSRLVKKRWISVTWAVMALFKRRRISDSKGNHVKIDLNFSVELLLDY